MGTTPTPPSSSAPQQQAVGTGTTSPKTRLLVLVFMIGIILILLYSILHPSATSTRRKRTGGKGETPSEEQINAAMQASQSEIEIEKARKERDKKRQDGQTKTADLQKRVNVAPRSIGVSERKKSAPSIVFDVTKEQYAVHRGGLEETEETAETAPVPFSADEREKRTLELVRQLISESRPASAQVNTLPASLVNDGRYQKTEDREQTESEKHAAVMHAHLLPPDPDWPKTVLPEGTIIETVLKNRLEGANDGPVEVMVTTDVYLRGTHKLIFPKGTSIFGETKKVQEQDQERLAVFFHTVLVELPDGELYEVPLDAPALDQTGATALEGKVNHHYLQIFGMSLAVGAVGGLVNIGNTYGGYQGYDTASTIRSGVGSEMGMSARQIMAHYLNRLPTVVIPEGTRVKIMLAGDVPTPFYPGETEEDGIENGQ
jgi:type IV secretory pathway VirB10-like protein